MFGLNSFGRIGAIVRSAFSLTPFSPLSLFASSEQGVWYDLSDLSTMFQDRAGTTPDTADGQTVGLILDKSKGLVLGSELVTNGTFASDVANWAITSGTGSLTWNNGTALLEATSNPAACQTFATVAGKWYRLSLSIVSATADAGVTVNNGSSFGFGRFYATNAPGAREISGYFLAIGPNSTICLFAGGTTGVSATFDNVSVKELPGNHAVAPSDAARPLYKTDGTYHWLQYDGVDDYIEGAWTTPTSLSTVFAGLRRIDDEAWVMFMREVTAAQGYLGVCQAGNTGSPDTSSGTPSYAVNHSLVTPTQRGALDTAMGFSSAKVVTIEDVNFNDGAFPWNAFGFGIYSGLAPQFRVYSVIALGRQATSQEITDTETWVAAKTGVTL